MDDLSLDEGYQITLPDFEGPLDLLLHLVRRHELNIFDIPISFITEKYLEYIDMMRALNLDVAGEYLLMAATLALIKSKELLPQDPSTEEEPDQEEEEVDPREELIRRLLEYQKYREAAKQLGDRPSLGREVFRRGVPMDPVDPKEIPFAEVSTFALISALSEVLNRSQVKLTHDVVVDRISITDRINHIVDRLLETENVRFADCFNFSGSTAQIRHDVIVTFLAILEMARLRMICIRQESSANEIILFRTTDLRTVSQEVQEDYS